MTRDTARSLARICRRLRLPYPRHDRSLTHGRWLEPVAGANARQDGPCGASNRVPAAFGAEDARMDAQATAGATGPDFGGGA